MHIRTKLLLLLLAITLLPMIALRLLNQSAVEDMSEEIASNVRGQFMRRTALALEQQVRDHAQVLRREHQLLDLALRFQADVLDEVLSGGVTESDDSSQHSGETPISTRHCRQEADGTCQPEIVQWDQLRFIQGADSPEAAKLVRAVADMRELALRYSDMILWQSVRLESGMEAVYPGNSLPVGGRGSASNGGGKSRRTMGMHMHRKEPTWHRAAMEAGKTIWSTPHIDPLTRKYVISVATPLYELDKTAPNGKGKIIGSTAIIVEVSSLLRVDNHLRALSDQVKYMLVREEEREGQEAPGLRVLAREYGLQEGDSHPQGMMRYWSALTREEWMESADMLTMSSIIADIKVKRSGVRVLTVNGVPNIAAYGDIGSGNIALLLLVPRAEATKDADSAEAFVLERVRRELIFSGIVMGGAILAVVIVAVYLSRRFTSRIEKLAKGFNLVSKGDFSVRLKVTGKDELGRLARGFNVMVPSLEEHIRMSKAMDVASEIQQQFLPAEPPQVCGLEIAATSIYSESMGGDYYDFMPCEQDCRNLAMAVGDVTGHGLPAALLMTTARGYLRQRAAMPGGPAQVLEAVNRQLCRDVDQTGRFLTMFYAVWHPDTRILSWGRAGHDPALLLDPESGIFTELQGQGLPLGTLEDWIYEQRQQELLTGQLLFIGTDGIWETQNSQGELYGKDRLREVLRNNASRSASEVVQAVLDDVEHYRGQAPQEDDVTLMVCRVVDTCVGSSLE